MRKSIEYTLFYLQSVAYIDWIYRWLEKRGQGKFARTAGRDVRLFFLSFVLSFSLEKLQTWESWRARGGKTMRLSLTHSLSLSIQNQSRSFESIPPRFLSSLVLYKPKSWYAKAYHIERRYFLAAVRLLDLLLLFFLFFFFFFFFFFFTNLTSSLIPTLFFRSFKYIHV